LIFNRKTENPRSRHVEGVKWGYVSTYVPLRRALGHWQAGPPVLFERRERETERGGAHRQRSPASRRRRSGEMAGMDREDVGGHSCTRGSSDGGRTATPTPTQAAASFGGRRIRRFRRALRQRRTWGGLVELQELHGSFSWNWGGRRRGGGAEAGRRSSSPEMEQRSFPALLLSSGRRLRGRGED
jgi:hypothetical protein